MGFSPVRKATKVVSLSGLSREWSVWSAVEEERCRTAGVCAVVDPEVSRNTGLLFGGVPPSTSLLRSGENDERSPPLSRLWRWRSSGKLQNEPLAANRARWTRYRRHSSISAATNPVQPVWWEAPRPAPLSPWKNS